MPSVYAIALGSNRRHGRHGAPAGVVGAALAALAEVGQIGAASRIRATPAMGGAGRGFANAVALVETLLAPDALLAELKRIERDFGRRPGRKWGPRVLDLDIILWTGGAYGGPGPIIPHPDYRGRRFVLDPLAEIAPEWRDPLTGASIRQVRARLRKPIPTGSRH